MNTLKKATFKQKEINSLPKGAIILGKDVSITVEEIENGFLISKSTETKYQLNKRNDCSYYTKRYFSKNNPLELDMDKFSDKSFVENFE